MTEEPDNIVLIYLRRLDKKMDRLIEDMHDVKVRLTSVENNLAGVQRRIDRLEDRFERIENRLDLREDAMFDRDMEKFKDQDD